MYIRWVCICTLGLYAYIVSLDVMEELKEGYEEEVVAVE